MEFASPLWPAPTADERELLLGYIHLKRSQVVEAARGLSDDQLRWTPDGRLMPIGGILNHLTHMEWRWVEGRYDGKPFPPRDPHEHMLPTGASGADLVGGYLLQAERTAQVVREAATLDAPCLGDEAGRGAAHLILGYDVPVTLRWVLLHVLEETAHHAGHADSTREMLDGRKMQA